MRFSELKPQELENKLFDYHLKKVISAGLIEKAADGTYTLTSEGRRLGIHVLENTQALVDRAYSVLFLVIRRSSDGAWLLYKRRNHPLKDRVGFMHVIPNSLESATQTAQSECNLKTGLDCTFSPLGNGYFRVFENNELQSFTHFTLLSCEAAEGELTQNNELAEYMWVNKIDATDSQLLPSMPLLLEKYLTQKPFYIDETIHL